MSLRVLVTCLFNVGRGGGSSIRARVITLGLTNCGAAVGIAAPDSVETFSTSNVKTYPVELGRKPFLEAIIAAGQDFKPNVILNVTEGGADAALMASKILDCACIFDLHGIGVVEILELGRGYGNRLQRLRNSARWLNAVRKGSHVIVANPTLLRPVKILNSRATLVAGAVDVNHFSPDGKRIQLGAGENVQVLYAGNFLRWQGCDLLLEAAQQIILAGHPYEFTLVGRTANDEAFVNKWRGLTDTSRVHFEDAVGYDVIPAFLRSADILIIPRPWLLSTYLAFPNKLTDYMATGRAIVATNLEPHRYALEDEVTGILCGRSPKDIAEALLVLADGNLRRRLGINARDSAVKRFSAERASAAIYDTLERVVVG
jgi:glycosyltransferase involved in cell wall biosynthesis